MIIVVRIIFAHFTNEVFNLVTCRCQECFLHVEEFFFNTLWKGYFKFTRFCYQQELLVERGRRRKSNEFKHCIQTSVNLLLEGDIMLVVIVVDNREVWMTYPRIDKLLVKFNSIFARLIASFIVGVRVKLCGAIS